MCLAGPGRRQTKAPCAGPASGLAQSSGGFHAQAQGLPRITVESYYLKIVRPFTLCSWKLLSRKGGDGSGERQSEHRKSVEDSERGKRGRRERRWSGKVRRGKAKADTDRQTGRLEREGRAGRSGSSGSERGPDTGFRCPQLWLPSARALPGLETDATGCFLKQKPPHPCGGAEPLGGYLAAPLNTLSPHLHPPLAGGHKHCLIFRKTPQTSPPKQPFPFAPWPPGNPYQTAATVTGITKALAGHRILTQASPGS